MCALDGTDSLHNPPEAGFHNSLWLYTRIPHAHEFPKPHTHTIISLLLLKIFNVPL